MPTTGHPPRRSGQLRQWWTILALTCAVLLTGSSCVLLDFPQTAANRTLRTIVTFYAAYDNDPPGTTTIAFPNARHAHAGGTGTADDPVTLASAPAVVAVGTTIYYPPLRKYFAAWVGVTALQLVAGVFAFRLERERLRPLWLLPLQQVVYRQLMYAVLLQSAVTAFAGVRLRWQKLAHRGDFTAAPVTDAAGERFRPA
jgi:hypothetical protein